VAIVVYDGVELLDFSGPYEAFVSAGQGSFRVFTVGPTHQTVLSQNQLKVTPDYSIDDSPQPDIVVLPGGSVQAFIQDPRAMAWVSRIAARTELAMSVCNGAYILAGTGLLYGKPATTHWSAIRGLRKAFPKVDVKEEVRFIDDGKVMTTAGVSAGIDGALHVIDRMLGPDVAWETARYMQYDAWEPAESASLSHAAKEALRALVFRDAEQAETLLAALAAANPGDAVTISRLGRAQVRRGASDKGIATLQRAVALGDRSALTLNAIAEAQVAAGQNAAAAATFETLLAERGSPWDAYNRACMQARMGNNEAALASLARAVALGFVARPVAETDDDLAALRRDPRFQKVLSGSAAASPTVL
jgi:transcriptional regulator GlxA family with amidase domain